MGVYLRGAYVLVAQHALDDTQVGPSLEQVRSERVAQGVRTDGLLDPCLLGQFLDDVKHRDARHLLLEVSTHEEVVLITRLDLYLGTVGHVLHDLRDGALRDGHQALLATLTLDLDEAFVQVQVRELQVTRLRHTQSAAVHRLYDGAVTLPLTFAAVDDGDERIYLLHAEHLGQRHAYLGRFEQQRRVGLDMAFKDKVSVERADAREHASLRAGAYPRLIVQRGQELLQVLKLDIEGVHTLLLKMLKQPLHIVHIGIQRIGREPLLKQQVLLEFLYQADALYLVHIAHESCICREDRQKWVNEQIS